MRRGESQVSSDKVDRARAKHMKKQITVLTLCAMLLVLSVSVQAQQQKKVPRVGFLLNNPSPEQGRQGIFRQALRDLGWIEGENIVIEYRYAEGKSDRFPALAAE